MTDLLERISIRAKAALSLPPPAARKAIREAAGVTALELAKAVGVSDQSIYYWERGERRPSGDHLVRYLEALDACRGRE